MNTPVSAIIPTLNAGPLIERLIAALRAQQIPEIEIVVVDSSSDDGTAAAAARNGASVLTIPRATFDHGESRAMAGRYARGEYLVYITQDALPCGPDSVATLVAALEQRPAVGASYGRQVPHPGASACAAFLRHFNYPAQSATRSYADKAGLGFRTCFLSNSYAAYRRSALEAVGWFKAGIIWGEDQEICARLLRAGYEVYYAADAEVFHSHDYSLTAEFRRSFDTGVFHSSERWILDEFGRPDGMGMRYARDGLAYLAAKGRQRDIPGFVVRSILKYAAYRAGLRHRRLPRQICLRATSNPRWWNMGTVSKIPKLLGDFGDCPRVSTDEGRCARRFHCPGSAIAVSHRRILLPSEQRKTVAVLGAGGFFGSRFVEQCIGREELHVVPVLRSFRSLGRISKFDMPYRLADTGNPDALAAALAGSDAVINTTMGHWLRIAPDTEIIYEAVRRSGVPLLVYISSAAVFGAVENPQLNDDSVGEGAAWMLYAREKMRAESFLRKAMKSDAGPCVVVLRPCLIWGPRSSWSTDPARLLASGRAWLGNGGNGICNLCYIDNLVRFVLAVVESPTAVSGFYNVADRETVTWREYYAAIASGLGFPADRVRLSYSTRAGLSVDSAVERLRQSRAVYGGAKWLLGNLSPETKSLLKYYVTSIAGGGELPPLHASDPLPAGPPAFTREASSAHRTRRKLPGTKFYNRFGDPGLVPFEAAMQATVSWLRFAGYADF